MARIHLPLLALLSLAALTSACSSAAPPPQAPAASVADADTRRALDRILADHSEHERPATRKPSSATTVATRGSTEPREESPSFEMRSFRFEPAGVTLMTPPSRAQPYDEIAGVHFAWQAVDYAIAAVPDDGATLQEVAAQVFSGLPATLRGTSALPEGTMPGIHAVGEVTSGALKGYAAHAHIHHFRGKVVIQIVLAKTAALADDATAKRFLYSIHDSRRDADETM